MNIYLKVLAAGALALGLAQTASASTQVRIGVYSGPPVAYRQHVVPVQPYYAPAPRLLRAAPVGYAEPSYRGRHDWRARREARLRREEWRREQWRREQWRREHWRNDRGWDGRR